MTNQLSLKENKMGVMPIRKLLISMSLPMVCSMLVQALYNIVDSIFVSRISEDAFTAVSIAFPVQNLMIAIGVGTGVGVNALLAKSLGEKNYENANKIAKNGIFLSALSYVLFLIIGLFFTKIFFRSQTDNASIIEYGSTYLSICSIFSFGLFGQLIFEKIMQATGRTLYSMFTQLIGAIINIILDPILIFGLFGFPELGVAGAAIATVLGQIVAMVIAILINHYKNDEVKINFKRFRPNTSIIKKIYSIGLPSIIMTSITSILTFSLNQILMAFSSTATAVLGAYFKLQSFIFMPVFGLNNGMVPIIAYNYGAQKKDRMKKTFKLSVTYAICIMILGLLVMQIFPTQLFKLFEASEHMLKIGIPALKIISLSFIFAGFCIVVSSLLQAVGHGLWSMTISIIRQLIILLPAAYFLSRFNDVNLVWWAFPIAELFSVTICIIFLKRISKKIFQ